MSTQIKTYIRQAGRLALSLWLVTSAWAVEKQVIRGHVLAAKVEAKPLARLPSADHLRLAIGLPLRNPEALTRLLDQLYDPASPQYRHYLTPEQFVEQFGPALEDYEKLIAFARTNGLKVTGTHPNRTLLDVSGSVADVD
jgi:subtilase family serine protease